jgi:hypothetical protein
VIVAIPTNTRNGIGSFFKCPEREKELMISNHKQTTALQSLPAKYTKHVDNFSVPIIIKLAL